MVIIACLVLNNMALLFGDPPFANEEPTEEEGADLDPEVPNPSEAGSRAAGEAHRESLLRFFEA